MTRSAQVRSHIIESRDGVRLHVAEVGPTTTTNPYPPVMVLHGFTGNGDTMAPVVEALSATRVVYALDLVGHGRSEAPDDVSRYSMDAVAGQVADVVTALVSGPADVVGYSLGGRVALCTSVWHPERVRRLAVIGASAGLATAEERSARRAADAELAERILHDGLEWFVDLWMSLPLFASQTSLGPEWAAASRRQRLANSPVGLANSLLGTGTGTQPPMHEHLAQLRAPVTFLAGELDDKYVEIARSLAAAVPRGEARIVTGAGHAAHLEAPHEVAAILRAALS